MLPNCWYTHVTKLLVHTCYQTVGTHMLPNCWYAVDSLVGFTLPIARSVGVTRQILTLEIDSKRPTDL